MLQFEGMAQISLEAHNLPSETEVIVATETIRVLASRKTREGLRLRLVDDPQNRTIELPASSVVILVRVLEEMEKGNAVTILPVHAELTSQEAADVLNISRPSLIDLLQRGEIPFRKVGTHRRIRFDDVMAYKRNAEAARRAALEELAAYDQELGL
jgi:excisionase family DNA binding protein